MKNTILILMIALFGLSSCKKEPETFCWECIEAYAEESYDGTIIVDVIDYDVRCGLTNDEANNLEYEIWINENLLKVKSCEKQ